MWTTLKNLFKRKDDSELKLLNFANKFIHTDKLLDDLIESQAPLTIKFEDSDEQYITCLLKNNKDKRHIILNAISAPDGHKKAMKGAAFTVSNTSDNIFISFTTRILKHTHDHEHNEYILPYPCNITYHQRRKAFRVPTNQFSGMHANLDLQKEGIISTNVVDMSISGMRLVAEKNLTKQFKNIKQSVYCNLTADFIIPSDVTVIINDVYFDFIKKVTVITCEFTDMSADKQLHLIEVVGMLQRHKIFKQFDQSP